MGYALIPTVAYGLPTAIISCIDWTLAGIFAPHPWQHANDGQNVIGMLLHDRSGHYWLDTMSGLGISEGTQVQNVPIYSLSAHGLVKPSWAIAYEDREGGLWFASLSGGLWHLPPNWSTFFRCCRTTLTIHNRWPILLYEQRQYRHPVDYGLLARAAR